MVEGGAEGGWTGNAVLSTCPTPRRRSRPTKRPSSRGLGQHDLVAELGWRSAFTPLVAAANLDKGGADRRAGPAGFAWDGKESGAESSCCHQREARPGPSYKATGSKVAALRARRRVSAPRASGRAGRRLRAHRACQRADLQRTIRAHRSPTGVRSARAGHLPLHLIMAAPEGGCS